MTRKLNLTVSGALERYADLTQGGTSRRLTTDLQRAHQIIADAEPELSDAEREIVEPLLAELLLARGDKLPTGPRLAAEVGELLASREVLAGVDADLAERITNWPLASIWALAEGLNGDVITMSAKEGPSRGRGRPSKPPQP